MKGFKDLLSKGSEAVKATAASAAAKAGQLKDRVGKALPSIGQKFEINGRSYRSKKLVGEGGYGFVYLVENVDNGQQHALKQLNVGTRDQLEQAKNEINIMRSLSYSKYIVKLLDSTIQRRETGNEVLVLMEFCSGGGLTDLLNDYFQRNKKLAEPEILAIFQDICAGVSALHNRDEPIAHRDLKVENVLLGADNTWKLCDFGSATTKTYRCDSERERNQAEDDIQKNTTMDYRAPEMIDLFRKQLINTKADIWALGVLLFRLAFFRNPFEEGSPLGILNCNYEIPENSKYSDALHGLIRWLLTPDPAQRPDVNAVLEKVSQLLGRKLELPKAPPKEELSSSQGSATSFDDEVRAPSPAPGAVPKAAGAPTKSLIDMLDWSDGGGAAPAPASSHQRTASQGRAADSLVDFAPPDSAADDDDNSGGGRGGSQRPGGYADPNKSKSSAARPAPASTSRGAPAGHGRGGTPGGKTKGPLQVMSFGIENTEAVTSFLQRLKKKPLASDPAKCLQYVVPFHQFLLSASPSVLNETYATLYPFVESLRDKYTEQRIKDADASDVVELLSQYGALLAKKVFFHRRHPEFNGDLSINEGVRSIPLNTLLVREVLEFQRHAITVLNLVLPGGGTPSDAKVAAVAALVPETFALYQLSLFVLLKNYGEGGVPAPFAAEFRAQFAAVGEAFAQIRALQSQWRFEKPVAVPDLPPTFPELSSAVTAVRIPSKKVTQVSIPVKPVIESAPAPAPARRPGEPSGTARRAPAPAPDQFAPSRQSDINGGDYHRTTPEPSGGSRSHSPAIAEPSRSAGKATPPPAAAAADLPELSAPRPSSSGPQTSVEKLKNVDVNAMHQKILAELRRLPENRVCADCGRLDPTWAVVNLGIFVCLSCSGVHRSLGTHISKVRSITLDTWEQDFVDYMKAMGNKRAKEFYEAGVPPGYQPPRENDSQYKIKQWIIAKYDKKEFLRGTPPVLGQAAPASAAPPTQPRAADLFSFDPEPPARTPSPAVQLQSGRTPSPAANLMDFGPSIPQPNAGRASPAVSAPQASASAFDDTFFMQNAAPAAPARPSPVPSPAPPAANMFADDFFGGASAIKPAAPAAAASSKPAAAGKQAAGAGGNKLFDMLDWQQ